MRSLKERKPVDCNGNFIPWMNFPVSRLLDDRLSHDLNLFEYGSGYSTLFYARKVKAVTAVEHDVRWLETIRPQIPDNVTLIFREMDIDGDYCRAIGLAGGQYDVVIVDGRDRVNCLRQSLAALSARGVIVLDDSQRERYQAGIALVRARGFKGLAVAGMKAVATGIETTTIFYRPDNCLGI